MILLVAVVVVFRHITRQYFFTFLSLSFSALLFPPSSTYTKPPPLLHTQPSFRTIYYYYYNYYVSQTRFFCFRSATCSQATLYNKEKRMPTSQVYIFIWKCAAGGCFKVCRLVKLSTVSRHCVNVT